MAGRFGRRGRPATRAVAVTAARAVAVAATALALVLGLAACGGAAASRSTSATAPAAAPSSAAGSPTPRSSAVPRSIPDGDWTQFGYDARRDGVGPTDTGITRADLGRLRAIRVAIDGTVDGAVVALHDVRVAGRVRDVLIMTTTYGRTIALDARTGARLWEYSPPDIGSLLGSAQVTTASPTVDPDRRFVYVATPDGIVHKLSVTDGRAVWSTRVLLDPSHQKLASPASISGPLLVVATDGYNGDTPPYQGHVVTLDRATGAIEHIFNSLCSTRRGLIDPSTCSASDSAIWGRAGATIVPGSRDILVATSNGPFNGRTNWGDSVLELSPDASRLLHNWTPVNQRALNSGDLDLGSASPALLPIVDGHRLILQGGKAGLLELLDLARLDGTSGPAGPRLGGELQSVAAPGRNQVRTQPVVWTHDGRTLIFVADDSGTAAYALDPTPTPHLSVLWRSAHPGTSPVLAGGLLYVYDELAGRLEVDSPTSGRLLASLRAAPGHWNSPIVVGGRIVLPVGNANDHATSGTIYIYRLPGR